MNMEISAQMPDDQRRKALQALLSRLRDETYEGIARYRQDQSEEKESSPGDEMDAARASTAVDTHANLIDRAENRLRLIDEALARVANGTYGICAECGDEIGLERLKVLPFAVRCVDCESQRARGAGSRLAEPSGPWTPPPDMTDVDAEERERETPDDLSVVASESAFDIEPEEMEEPPAPRGRGRRGRPRSS